jgi:hypothetical protein
VTAQDAIRLARKHLGEGPMEESARSCLTDAIRLYDAGDYPAALARAARSIDYSTGIYHPDCRRAYGLG